MQNGDWKLDIENSDRVEDVLMRHRIRDVIVIGSDGSGIRAALSAARHGAGVTMLEHKKNLAEVYAETYPELEGFAEVIHGCRVIGVEQDDHRWFAGGEFYLLVNAVFIVPVQLTAIAVILAKTERSHIIMNKNKRTPGFFTALEDEDAEVVGKAAAEFARTAWRAE